jgi:hypothetical protein
MLIPFSNIAITRSVDSLSLSLPCDRCLLPGIADEMQVVKSYNVPPVPVTYIIHPMDLLQTYNINSTVCNSESVHIKCLIVLLGLPFGVMLQQNLR